MSLDAENAYERIGQTKACADYVHDLSINTSPMRRDSPTSRTCGAISNGRDTPICSG